MLTPHTDFLIPRFVAIGTAATYASVSARTLRRQIRSGQLPAFKVGKRLLLTLTDVDALVRAHPAAVA
jgi:excisionase family DNA binding protein